MATKILRLQHMVDGPTVGAVFEIEVYVSESKGILLHESAGSDNRG